MYHWSDGNRFALFSFCRDLLYAKRSLADDTTRGWIICQINLSLKRFFFACYY